MRDLHEESSNFQTDSTIKPMNVAKSLINWYLLNKRSLPWREISDPYRIWLSEIILQQTQVIQGTDYYLRFISRFPDIQSLANAQLQEVMHLWQGLGYYSRGRNLHEAAKQIMDHFGGVFPNNFDDILSLKGVGPYTAAAIASIAFGEKYAVLDGNVFRVLSRLFADDTDIGSGKGKRHFQSFADKLLNPDHPGDHNQAMMELGATICTPQNPNCTHCCIQVYCRAFKTNTTMLFPAKLKKTKVKNRYFVFLVVHRQSSLLMGRREEKDIWRFLYQFPLIECNKKQFGFKEAVPFINQCGGNILPSDGWEAGKMSELYLHRLTHRLIHARFIEIHCPAKQIQIDNYRFIPPSEINQTPVPKLISKYLEKRRPE